MNGILLLGANGQLGKEFLRVLPETFPTLSLHAFNRQNGDILNFEWMQETIETLRPQIIINAAAYTAVDKAEEEKELCFAINHQAVKNLAEIAQKTQSLLVHFSTDYVFDGKKNHYIESDFPSPQNIYGKSKLKGEEAIIKSQCPYLIFRTSWVFGSLGNNFVKSILNLAQKNEVLNIVGDQSGSPTSARFLAQTTGKAILECLKNNQKTGLYHLSNSSILTWFDFAKMIIEEAQNLNFPLKVKRIEKITTQDFPQKALRPQNSVLNCLKFEKTFNIKIPDFNFYLKTMLKEIKNDFV